MNKKNKEFFERFLSHRHDQLEAELRDFLLRQEDEEVMKFACRILEDLKKADEQENALQMVRLRLALYAFLVLFSKFGK